LCQLDFNEPTELLKWPQNIQTGENQGATDKRKHITSMIPQKLDMIRWLENGKSQSMVMA